MVETSDQSENGAHIEREDLGLALSRELIPIRFEQLGNLLPFSRFLEFCVSKLSPSSSDEATKTPRDAAEELRNAANAAEAAISLGVSKFLSTGKLDTFVSDAGRNFSRIPPAYWGGFHAYRPLAGMGFCADADLHGPLDGELDGRPIFIEEDQFQKVIDQSQAAVTAETVKQRKTNKEPAWLSVLRKEMEYRDKAYSAKRMLGKAEPRWPKSPFFRDQLIKSHRFPEDTVAKSTVRGWVARINEDLGR